MKKVCSFIKKETPTQVFSSEFNENLKSTYIEEHLRTAVSVSVKAKLRHFKQNACLQFFKIMAIATPSTHHL